MNSKFLKIYYIVAASFAGLGVVYYIARLIDLIVNPNTIEGTLLDQLNVYALVSFGIALLMLVIIIPITLKMEKDAQAKMALKAKDQENLAKYKSKKTK